MKSKYGIKTLRINLPNENDSFPTPPMAPRTPKLIWSPEDLIN